MVKKESEINLLAVNLLVIFGLFLVVIATFGVTKDIYFSPKTTTPSLNEPSQGELGEGEAAKDSGVYYVENWPFDDILTTISFSKEDKKKKVKDRLSDLLYAADAGLEGDKGESIKIQKGTTKKKIVWYGTTIPKETNILLVSVDADGDGGGSVIIELNSNMGDADWKKIDKCMDVFEWTITAEKESKKRKDIPKKLKECYSYSASGGSSGSVDSEEIDEYDGVIDGLAGLLRSGGIDDEEKFGHGDRVGPAVSGSFGADAFKERGSVTVQGTAMDF